MNTAIPKMLVVLALGGAIAGCASVQPGDLDEVRALAERAAADAAAANQAAAEAQARANRAMDVADEAKATADDTEAKIDRMFKKSMYK